MERALILETSFLVDLEREHNRDEPARAVAFLEANADANLYLPFVVPGELAAGVSMARRDRWEALVAPADLARFYPDKPSRLPMKVTLPAVPSANVSEPS